MRTFDVPQLLGVAGIVGGLSLLAAFVAPISLNTARLVVFPLGSSAVAAGMAMAYPGTNGWRFVAPVITANAVYAAMVLVALGIAHPSAGAFGLTFFVAGWHSG